MSHIICNFVDDVSEKMFCLNKVLAAIEVETVDEDTLEVIINEGTDNLRPTNPKMGWILLPTEIKLIRMGEDIRGKLTKVLISAETIDPYHLVAFLPSDSPWLTNIKTKNTATEG